MEWSPAVLEHFERPRNVGSLPREAPDVGTGMVGTPACGDVVRIQLRIAGDRVVAARFKTFGCASAIAASSLATELVSGRTVGEAWAVSGAEIAHRLALPASRIHCGVFAASAIRQAIEDWQRKQGVAAGHPSAERSQLNGD